jgi:hypothetical protein
MPATEAERRLVLGAGWSRMCPGWSSARGADDRRRAIEVGAVAWAVVGLVGLRALQSVNADARVLVFLAPRRVGAALLASACLTVP